MTLLLLEIVVAAEDVRTPDDGLTLAFEHRRRARLRARLDGGTEVGLLLERGLALKHGDRLQTRDGSLLVEVRAKPELLSVVESADKHLLTRAAYHLGNRHVPLQVEPGWLAYHHDHVLDGLMNELGLEVTVSERPFEPEAGGYSAGHGHAREHHHHSESDHDHDHSGHTHEQGPEGQYDDKAS